MTIIRCFWLSPPCPLPLLLVSSKWLLFRAGLVAIWRTPCGPSSFSTHWPRVSCPRNDPGQRPTLRKEGGTRLRRSGGSGPWVWCPDPQQHFHEVSGGRPVPPPRKQNPTEAESGPGTRSCDEQSLDVFSQLPRVAGGSGVGADLPGGRLTA